MLPLFFFAHYLSRQQQQQQQEKEEEEKAKPNIDRLDAYTHKMHKIFAQFFFVFTYGNARASFLISFSGILCVSEVTAVAAAAAAAAACCFFPLYTLPLFFASNAIQKRERE